MNSMSTPLWVPLVVAAFGLVSTVVGIVVTQVMANRRERANWQRDTDREQQRWQREDQARTFEHRRAAYGVFYDSLCHDTLLVTNYVNHMNNPHNPNVPPITLAENWYHHLFRQATADRDLRLRTSV
jgi:Na+/glutamate symporter